MSLMENLTDFVEQLLNIADRDSELKIRVVHAYLKSETTDTKSIENAFARWIRENTTDIHNKNDKIFEICINGDISIVINQIGSLWSKLPKVDKDVIWLWLDSFVEQIN